MLNSTCISQRDSLPVRQVPNQVEEKLTDESIPDPTHVFDYKGQKHDVGKIKRTPHGVPDLVYGTPHGVPKPVRQKLILTVEIVSTLVAWTQDSSIPIPMSANNARKLVNQRIEGACSAIQRRKAYIEKNRELLKKMPIRKLQEHLGVAHSTAYRVMDAIGANHQSKCKPKGWYKHPDMIEKISSPASSTELSKELNVSPSTIRWIRHKLRPKD